MFTMHSENNDHSSLKKEATKKRFEEILCRLTAPDKVLVQVEGWTNICGGLDYMCSDENKLLSIVTGFSFELDALTQIVGCINAIEKLKKRVLLGKTLKAKIFMYEVNDEIKFELIEGLDDLERRLEKVKAWGCDFVILQVQLGHNCTMQYGTVPQDNSHFFGIFSSTVQALGMVPVIQFKYDFTDYAEIKSHNFFSYRMAKAWKALYEFDVEIEFLMVSLLMKFPLKNAEHNLEDSAILFTRELQRGLPPSVGGVVFAGEGSAKALASQMDRIAKLVERKPWPIVSGYCCTPPADIPEDNTAFWEKWFNKQAIKAKMLSKSQRGQLVPWVAKPTEMSEEFIKTHSHSKTYEGNY